MNLQEARTRLPELEGLSDEHAIDVIQQVYYPEVDRAKIEKALGYTPPPPPKPERSAVRAVGDLGLQFAGGAVSGVRMMTDLAGADNAASRGLRSAEDALQALQSATAKADQQEIAAIMKEAEGKGFADQVVAGVRAFGTAPAAMIAQAIGTSLPTLATALIPGAGAAAIAARVGAAGAIGAGQGAGAIKGAIYDEVKANPLPGETAEQTEARAIEAQAYSGPNVDQIALGGGLGAVAGTTGIERAAGALRHGVTRAAPGIMGRIAMGAATEAVPEAVQGGQEKFATNTALAREGMQVDPWAGVVAGGTMEALAGAATGGAFGIPNPGVNDPVKAAGDAVRARKVAGTGPMTRAVNAGTEQQAQQAEANVAAEVEAIESARGPAGAPSNLGATSLTGTDAATLMEPPENPLLGAAKALQSDRQEEARADAAMARMERRNARDQASLRDFSSGDGASPASAVPSEQLAQPGDIYNPSGDPFKSRMAADRAVKKNPGEVIAVPGGFVIRPVRQETPVAAEAAATQAPKADAVPVQAGATPAAAEPAESGVSAPGAPLVGTQPLEALSAAPAQPEATQGEWQTFPAETSSLNLPRAEMPQVKAEHRGAMVNFLNARGVEHEADEMEAAELKPTQAEYSLEKVRRAQEFGGTDRSILVSSDGYVVDGHHQWLAKGNAGQPVKVIRLKAPIRDLLPLVREFPSSTVDTATADVPNEAPAATAAPAQPEETQAARPETPAPAGGDGATASGVSDAGGTGDAQAAGVSAARQKALDRITRGTAYFSTAEKAQDFISSSTISDTHEAVQARPGRFEIREKGSAAPPAAPAPAASAPEYKDAKGRPIKAGDNVRYSSGGIVRHATIGGFGPNAEGAILAFDTDGRVIGQPRRTEIEVIEKTGAQKPTEAPAPQETAIERRERLIAERAPAVAAAPAPAPRKANAKEQQQAAVPAPAPAPAVSANTIFTEDAAAAARALLKKKLSGGTLNSGIDPELLQAGITLAGYHIERGARTFAAYAKAMLADLGDGVKPYLKSWYMGVKYDPRASAFDGMDSAAAVESADVDNLAPAADTQENPPRDENAARSLDRASPGALEGAPAQDVQGTAEAGPVGDAPARGGRGNEPADAATDGAGVPASRGVGSDARDVPVPARGTGDERGSARERGPAAAAGDERRAAVPRDDGRADRGGETGRVEPAAAATAPGRVQPPAFKPSDFTIEEDFALGEGGQKTKFRANLDAITLLKQLDAEQRHATPDEQAVLARYVGWGGLPQAFDAENQAWTKEFAALRAALGDEEYEAARRSTRYAHYTSRPVIQGMYDALKRLGFTGGKVLEPGAGVGNFVGLMPADLRSSTRMTGVEREPIAAGIARHLYPNQNMQLQDFTQFQATNGYFDAVIGNPPFASDGLTDQSGRKHLSGMAVHDYFFAKSIDLLREGGVFAAVVSNGFMDKAGDRARRYIGERARLLGAIRLPNNAFAANANTEVTTDIVFLQKLPEAQWGSKEAKADLKRWMDQAIVPDPNGGADLKVNRYFAEHPEMMLGELGRFGTMYGPDQPALVARAGQDTAALLRQAIERLPQGVYEDAAVAGTAKASNDIIEALRDATVQEGGFYVNDGKLYQRMPDRAGETSARLLTPTTQWTEKTTLGDSRFDRLVQLAGLRRTMRDLLAAELADDASMAKLRQRLNDQYDTYAAKHGLINDVSTAQVFEDDPDFPLLAALEFNYVRGMGPAAAKAAGIKPFKSKADKAPIFERRVIEKRQAVTKAETPEDALNISIAERGRVDAGYIASLLNRPADEVLDELTRGEKPALFVDPVTGEHVLRDAYLSGNVRKKLHQAKMAGADRNVRALMEVQPEDVGAGEISARIGAPWVPTAVYEDFIRHLLGDGTKATVHYMPLNNSFQPSISSGSDVANNVTYGTNRVSAASIFDSLLNNRSIKVMDTDANGKSTLNKEATDAANEKASDIKAKFQDWIFADSDRADVLVRAYNDTNNNYVTRVFDGSRMQFPGKVPDAIRRPRRHQRNAVARVVQDRTALLDHVVGAGKTDVVVMSAMELRRTGLARKPMVAVPNHLVKQWASDFYRLYPGANILTATKKDFERANRRRFLARIATGDWDAVIIAHSSFGFIKPDPDFEAQFNEQQIEHIEAAIAEVGPNERDKAAKRTVKQLEALKERLENRIKALRDKPVDDLLDFKQIGVDQLFVDEAHLFKNLMFSTKMQNVQGLGDSKGSQRAYDMLVKTAQIYAQNGREQGVVFATGTPVSNTLAEMYHMMRYLMPGALREQGFESFDAWANTFASVDQVWMQKPSGDGYKASDRLGSFNNAPELLKMFDQVADTVTMDDIKKAYAEENNGKEFPLPKLKGGKRTPVSLMKSQAQTDYMKDIAARAEALEKRKGPPMKGQDNFLTIMSDARKAAMDVRLVDLDRVEREPGGRIDRASDEVVTRYKQYHAVKGTQLVFSDLGTPLSGAKKEMKEYEELRARIEVGQDADVQAEAALGDEGALRKLEDAEAAQEELDAKGGDWLDAIKAALRGFSVYDDFKKALIEKGIPEGEIAFIHDYNTDEQKAGLFRKVNAGHIRVVLGSTPKMGAGTNVQERLVALHHLDVPWKPSDVEQREGRIIRQGNRLADTIPGFEVEILAYVTQDTLDMRMWQTQEVKLKMINQLRTRQVSREIENPFEQAEMSAGEMQAAATGNMDLLREIQIRADVKRLEQRKRSFDAQRNDLAARRRKAEQNMRKLPDQIAELEALAKPAQAYFRSLEDRPFSATINGQTVNGRQEAEATLRRLVGEHDDAMQAYTAAADAAGEAAGQRFPEGSPERSGAVMDARDAYLKDNAKPKMAVDFNGKTYGSKTALGEAMLDAAGDRDPIEWSVGGETYIRRRNIASAIEEAVVDAGITDTVHQLGHVGAFAVSVEGNRDRGGDRYFDVVLQVDGKSLDGQHHPATKADGRSQAEGVIRTVERLVTNVANDLRWAKDDLRRAKKALADLEGTSMPEVWPDQAKLEKARAEHKDVLQRLAGKGKEGGAGTTADAAPVQFSIAEGEVTGVSVDDARSIVDAIRAKWDNAPEVVVVDSLQDSAVPTAVREYDIQQRSLGQAGNPEGFWFEGKAYVVAGALNGPADVVRVLFHETLGHYGLRGQFGEALAPILKQIAALRRKEVQAKAKQYGLDVSVEAQRLMAAEEVLAEMAQSTPELGFVQRAIAAIRQWLREHVPALRDMKLTDAEIIRQYIEPARRFVEQGASAGTAFVDGVGTDGDTAGHGQLDTRPEAVFNIGLLGRNIAAHLGVSQRGADSLRPYDGRVLGEDGGLREIAEAFGSEVQGFDLRVDLAPEEKRRYGFFAGVRTGGIIFIRATGHDRPHMAVLGHELGHELRTKRPDLYNKLVDAIAPFVNEQRYETEFVKSVVARKQVTDDKRQEEFIGEVLSDGFMNRDFWRALGNTNPSLLRQIGGMVMDIVERVLRTVGYTKQTERYLTDYAAVMKIAGEVMGEFGQARPTSRGLMWSRADTPMFSRAGRPVGQTLMDAIPAGVMDRLQDMTSSQRGFNRWWHRTVGTQLHKAKTNKDFGQVFYAVQDFMKDVSRMATLAADQAPDLLPQVETLRDVRKVAPQMVNTKKRRAELKAASDALFDGTLRYTRNEDGEAVLVEADSEEPGGLVWSAEELRERGMSEEAIAMYRQARGAIDQSLDSLLASDIYRMLTGMQPEMLAGDPAGHGRLMDEIRRTAAGENPRAAVSAALRALAGQGGRIKEQVRRLTIAMEEGNGPEFLNKAAMTRATNLLNQIEQARETMQAKIDRIDTLQARGYAPLMRFGAYTVDALDADGNRVFFGMYETQFAANRAARRFRDDGLTVRQGVQSQREFEMLKGVSPETAMLFADMLGLEKNEVMQTWLQNALAEQSALKRHIRRKGVEGFDDDASRVVAAFLTSNSRAASRALHGLRIQEKVESVREGDVKDEAIALAHYVDNPREEAQAVRSLLFVNYIGGSIASALVNLTQTVVQTFPYLAQFGGAGRAARRLASAVKLAVGKIEDADLAAAVARAERDGVIKPQEVFQLQAEASRSLGSDLRVRAGLALWGSFFQAAEVFNRRVAFIAAYQTSKEEKIGSAFAFAENAVDETQGVFNKGNRPNWARGAVGATLFTFKTFTIQYVEFLKRLPPKEKALALAVLVVLSGFRGIPFAEDAEDIIDTVAQHLGYSFTTREAMNRFAANILGKEFADFLQNGASGTGLLPFDVSGRLGMGDLLPATGVLKPSETRRDEQVLEVFGVAGSFVNDALKGQVMPLALRNFAKGIEMYDREIYTDTRGRKVMDVSAGDAALKAIGLQPAGVAAESRAVSSQYEKRALFTKVKGEISEQMALGMFEGDEAKVRRARERLAAWNEKNPDQKIALSGQGIRRRVAEMRKDRSQRFASTSPRELRQQTREALAD